MITVTYTSTLNPSALKYIIELDSNKQQCLATIRKGKKHLFCGISFFKVYIVSLYIWALITSYAVIMETLIIPTMSMHLFITRPSNIK